MNCMAWVALNFWQAGLPGTGRYLPVRRKEIVQGWFVLKLVGNIFTTVSE